MNICVGIFDDWGVLRKRDIYICVPKFVCLFACRNDIYSMITHRYSVHESILSVE